MWPSERLPYLLCAPGVSVGTNYCQGTAAKLCHAGVGASALNMPQGPALPDRSSDSLILTAEEAPEM